MKMPKNLRSLRDEQAGAVGIERHATLSTDILGELAPLQGFGLDSSMPEPNNRSRL